MQPKEVKWGLMIASCYRRMNLFNEALKIYEDLYETNTDNVDCLRGLVQIRKELGMKYAQFSEKLMALDREEEAKRQYEYAHNQQNFAYNNMGGGPSAPLGEMPDMSDIPGPQQQRRAAKQAPQEDEGGWGDAADLLD